MIKAEDFMNDELRTELRNAGFKPYRHVWVNVKDIIIKRKNGTIEIHEFDEMPVLITEDNQLIKYLN